MRARPTTSRGLDFGAAAAIRPCHSCSSVVGKSRYASFTAAVPPSTKSALKREGAMLFWGDRLVPLAANSGNTPGPFFVGALALSSASCTVFRDVQNRVFGVCAPR